MGDAEKKAGQGGGSAGAADQSAQSAGGDASAASGGSGMNSKIDSGTSFSFGLFLFVRWMYLEEDADGLVTRSCRWRADQGGRSCRCGWHDQQGSQRGGR